MLVLNVCVVLYSLFFWHQWFLFTVLWVHHNNYYTRSYWGNEVCEIGTIIYLLPCVVTVITIMIGLYSVYASKKRTMFE